MVSRSLLKQILSEENHSFYSKPALVPASAVYKDFDTSWEEKPRSVASRRPAVWKQGGAVLSYKAVLEIFAMVCEEVRHKDGLDTTSNTG